MPPITPASLIATFQGVPLADRPLQLQSLASAGQYRLPYEVTQRFITGRGEALDWGCGDGHYSHFLRCIGHQVTAYSYEPRPPQLTDHAGFRFVPASTGDPVALPFPNGSFDMVFSVGVLEHVHETGGDQRGSVQELVRVLRPGGHLFVFHLPNRTSWIEAAARTLNRIAGARRFEHSLLFSEASARTLFAGLPAEVLEMGRYNALPRNSLARLPVGLANSASFCAAFDSADAVFARVAPSVCQNWYLVVRRTP